MSITQKKDRQEIFFNIVSIPLTLWHKYDVADNCLGVSCARTTPVSFAMKGTFQRRKIAFKR
jgi:hypothetical protein